MKKKNVMPYNVIVWDINRDAISYYDIMPYLINMWDVERKSKHKVFVDGTEMPSDREGIKAFILSVSKYQFWCRCEYEVIVTSWPVGKSDHKLDVYQQIENNIDVITDHFIKYVQK